MLRDQLVQLLAYRLGDRDDMAERIALEMLAVQSTILEEHEWLPWFLEKEWTSSTMPGSTAGLSLPEDFLMEIEEGHLYYTTPEGTQKRLKKRSYESAKSLTADFEVGAPQYYALLGSYLYVFPVTDAAYLLTWTYYGRDADMAASNVETLWLKYASDLVMAALGAEIAAKHLQNTEQAVNFQNDMQKAWARLYAKHVALQEVNMLREMGSE